MAFQVRKIDLLLKSLSSFWTTVEAFFATRFRSLFIAFFVATIFMHLLVPHAALASLGSEDISQPDISNNDVYEPARIVDGALMAEALANWISTQNFATNSWTSSWRTGVNLLSLWAGTTVQWSKTRLLVEELESWLLSQPDESVRPLELYQQAIIVGKGDVRLAFVLVWNLLSRNWEWEASRNYFLRTRKLFDITGEFSRFTTNLVPRIQVGADKEPLLDKDGFYIYHEMNSKRGDKFSAWYHFAGTAINTFLKSTGRPRLLPPGFETELAIRLERFLHRHDASQDSIKRIANDRQGNQFGARFAHHVRSILSGSFQQTIPSSDYIRIDQEQFPESYALGPEQTPHDYGTQDRSRGDLSRRLEIQELGGIMALVRSKTDRQFPVEVLTNFTWLIQAADGQFGQNFLKSFQDYLHSGVHSRALDLRFLKFSELYYGMKYYYRSPQISHSQEAVQMDKRSLAFAREFRDTFIDFVEIARRRLLPNTRASFHESLQKIIRFQERYNPEFGSYLRAAIGEALAQSQLSNPSATGSSQGAAPSCLQVLSSGN